MNRRQTLISMGALLALTTATPVWAKVWMKPLAEWGPGTLDNPHAALVAARIRSLKSEGVIYATGDFGTALGHVIKLTEPTFKVSTGKPVWNWMTGYTEEEGLLLSIYERGVHLGDVGIATSIGYEEYWNTPRNKADYPDYAVRNLYIPWEERDGYRTIDEVTADLPEGHVDFDTRWMKAFVDRHKAANA